MRQMRTQWRTSFSGVTGMDYGVLFALMDRLHLPDSEFESLFDDMQMIEAYSLEAIRMRHLEN